LQTLCQILENKFNYLYLIGLGTHHSKPKILQIAFVFVNMADLSEMILNIID